ncbi:hypothetical protein K458DRAFT_417127 [Lentithecium fluviatile CBS 122367]|uniref:Uncharacterized protein n=1 Tax=Lentithecium fluviatile CBS 122367 TaxID=1168545 RepID=A0A6G1J605_9PLEO|nr:hypothetical protein K458DRAFT_417127 [Lentithecium fluviatile CBS 122367]
MIRKSRLLPVVGKEEFIDSDMRKIMNQYKKWKGIGLSIPNNNATNSKVSKCTMEITTETGSRHGLRVSARRQHDAIKYAKWMSGRQTCWVKITRPSTRYVVCVVPRTARITDEICWLLGCPTLLVLRRQGKLWIVIGEAYIEDVSKLVDTSKNRCYVPMVIC